MSFFCASSIIQFQADSMFSSSGGFLHRSQLISFMLLLSAKIMGILYELNRHKCGIFFNCYRRRFFLLIWQKSVKRKDEKKMIIFLQAFFNKWILSFFWLLGWLFLGFKVWWNEVKGVFVRFLVDCKDLNMYFGAQSENYCRKNTVDTILKQKVEVAQEKELKCRNFKEF